MDFNYMWVNDFGWENTVFSPCDCEEVELLGENNKDGKVYIGIFSNGTKRIFKE